jgi:uncharacterized protein (DUF2147 family)
MHVFRLSDFLKAICPRLGSAIAALCLCSAAANTQPPAAGIAGLWIDHTGRGGVEIQPCGNHLCGRVAWLQQPTDPKGAPAKDRQGRTLCGLQIIGDLHQTSSYSWDGGWIYSPDDDETFSVELQLKSRDTLQVLGYMGMKVLGETFVWKRAPTTLAACAPQRPA